MDRWQRSIRIGEECENKRCDVREVLRYASITADAGVYQAVADEVGLRDGVMWILGYGLDKEIQS
jgi:hypothetical protein